MAFIRNLGEKISGFGPLGEQDARAKVGRTYVAGRILCLMWFGALGTCWAGQETLLNPAESKIRIGIGTKISKTETSQINFLGIEYWNYHSDVFFMGGAFYTGQVAAGATGASSMGGLLFGVHAFQLSPASLVLSLLVGAAGGVSTTGAGGMLLLPELDLFFDLGPTVKAAIDFGYEWVPGQTLISGIDLGAKIVFVVF